MNAILELQGNHGRAPSHVMSVASLDSAWENLPDPEIIIDIINIFLYCMGGATWPFIVSRVIY